MKLACISLLVVALAGICWANQIEDPFAYDPYFNFGAITVSQTMNGFVMPTYVPPNHPTTETVKLFTDGTGNCSLAGCSVMNATYVWFNFSTLTRASYIVTAPGHVTTTADYFFNSHLVDQTTQTGGVIWHKTIPGQWYDSLELTFSHATNFSDTFTSYDSPTPEPSTLFLLGSGLIAAVTYARRRLVR